MSVDLKDLEAVPTLTLDPLGTMAEKEVPPQKNSDSLNGLYIEK